MSAVLPLLPLVLLTACSTTLDHQAELLLHPDAAVQVPGLVGGVTGAVLGSPLWAPVALVSGSESDEACYALHAFAYPPALVLAGIPWLFAGPSFR